MSYVRYNNLGESKINGIDSKREKLQDMKIIQVKLDIHDSFKEDKNLATNFERTDNTDVMNKSYLDENFLKKRSLIIIRKRLKRV